MKKAVLAVYDIPDAKKKFIRNPSPILRRIGVRINLSAWIIPVHLIPWPKFNDIRGAGAALEVVEFAEHEYDKLKILAREALEKEAGTIFKSLLRSIEAAKKAYRAAEGFESPSGEDRRTRLEKSTARLLRKSKKLLVCAEEAAVAFELTADVQTVFDGIRDAIAAKNEAFLKWKAEGPAWKREAEARKAAQPPLTLPVTAAPEGTVNA